MDSRQRVRAALEHREPDRTPYFEYVLLSPVADVLLGRRYAGDPAHWPELVAECGWEEAVRRNAADRLDLALLLGHDLLYVTPNPPPPSPPTAPVPQEPLPEDPVERLRRRNAQAAGQLPPPGETFAVYVRLLELMKERDMDLPLLTPAYGHGVWTDTDLMQTMLLAPEVAEEHFALATRRSLDRIEKYLSLGIDLVGVGGDFSGTRPLISPEAYRHFIVPQVRTLSRRLHQAGAFAINASDGDLWPVIEDFLCGCEVDGYLEIDQYAGMELRRLKTEYGEKVCLIGNLDCGNTLSFGTPESIRRETLNCLEVGSGSGGHILCASNAITASVSLPNYLAVVHAYREWCGLPALELGR
jgi:hypothetical protein